MNVIELLYALKRDEYAAVMSSQFQARASSTSTAPPPFLLFWSSAHTIVYSSIDFSFSILSTCIGHSFFVCEFFFWPMYRNNNHERQQITSKKNPTNAIDQRGHSEIILAGWRWKEASVLPPISLHLSREINRIISHSVEFYCYFIILW